jgi:hypothetical protein
VWIGLIAGVVTISSLSGGLMMDDYHHCLVMKNPDNPDQFLQSKYALFSFINPERNSYLTERGLLPWWTDASIKGKFWRPITSMTHLLDYSLWPGSPALMHLQSVIWYMLLCSAVTVFYRKIIPIGWVAGFAALLYAVSETHAIQVGFLSNRNALLGAFFGVLALIAHDNWRRNKSRCAGAGAVVLLIFSLLSAEAGVGTCAYLGAYMLFLDESKWGNRLLSMLPYVIVVVIWRFAWSYLDYGVANIGMYVDPLNEPLRYIKRLPTFMAFFLTGQFALLPSSLYLFMYPATLKTVTRYAMIYLAIIFLILFGVLRRDRAARFFAGGMVLSVLPLCAAFPCNRMLIFTSIGALGLIAQLITTVFSKTYRIEVSRLWRVPAVVLATVMLITHLIISPFVLAFHSAMPSGPNLMSKMLERAPFTDADISECDLVLVNPPDGFSCAYIPLVLQCKDRPIPKNLRILTSSILQPVTIHRPDKYSLIVRPEHGFMAWAMDQLVRRVENSYALGEKIVLSGLTVEVVEQTPDGRCAAAVFTFDVPLEDETLRWVQWKNWQFEELVPPEVGETVVLENFE